jgi:hypothetical protein
VVVVVVVLLLPLLLLLLLLLLLESSCNSSGLTSLVAGSRCPSSAVAVGSASATQSTSSTNQAP